MADNLGVDVGTDATLATNETTIDAVAAQVQRVTLGSAPNVAYGTAPCNTSADLILAANTDRKIAWIKPIDGAVYIGDDASVATTTGYLLNIGEAHPVTSLGAVYGITASGTTDVRVWEES